MADVQFRLTDNSEATLRAFERGTRAALEACGQQAASHAKQIITSRLSGTGNLRNSINSAVSGKNAYVGTNVSYAKYHEMGTGIHTAGGRKTPWAYQGEDGKWHWTRGVPPLHFVKNSVADHVAQYRQIFLQYLSRL